MEPLPISDEYFNRSARIVEGTDRFRQLVRYCVFARAGGVICGANRSLSFIDDHTRGPLRIRGRRDGAPFAPNQAVLLIEGWFGELVALETTYLGNLAFSGSASRMAEIVHAAGPLPVVDMSARHYPFEMITQIAYAAAIGGARGTSTRAGCEYVHRFLGCGPDRIRVAAKEFDFKLYGSIPHALNAVFEGSSVQAALAYREKFPEIPLTVLIDFEGRELDICQDAARALGPALAAVRIDTHGHRTHQGGHDQPVPELVQHILERAPDKEAALSALDTYGFGPGVTIESVYNVRASLDSVGAQAAKIIVTSGFTSPKVAAFRAAAAPMDAIGTGSWVDFTVFTSDITHIFGARGWEPRCKAGRREEIEVPDLPILLEKNIKV